MTGAPAVLRFARDRRGYENFYLVQPASGRRGKGESRILYWFRTPPGVKVGRVPFDTATQRAIEAQNPGVVFDWERLVATPIPPPAADIERWRERRRAEKAEKAARASRQADVEAAGAAEVEEPAEAEIDDQVAEEPAPESGAETIAEQPVPAMTDAPSTSKRRRRRRRRHRRPQGAASTAQPDNTGDPAADSAAEIHPAEPADEGSKTS